MSGPYIHCSLQRFKLNIANTVISQDNSSLHSMNTAELLDLFQLSDTAAHSEISVRLPPHTHTHTDVYTCMYYTHRPQTSVVIYT